MKIILLAIIIAFGWLGKSYLFPSDLDRVKKELNILIKIASFQNPLPPIAIVKRVKSFESSVNRSIEVDLREYSKNEIEKVFRYQDIRELAPLYFSKITQMDIFLKDLTKLSSRDYKVVVILKGRTSNSTFDHAYLAEISFNDDWKLSKVKVLSAPE